MLCSIALRLEGKDADDLLSEFVVKNFQGHFGAFRAMGFIQENSQSVYKRSAREDRMVEVKSSQLPQLTVSIPNL